MAGKLKPKEDVTHGDLRLPCVKWFAERRHRTTLVRCDLTERSKKLLAYMSMEAMRKQGLIK